MAPSSRVQAAFRAMKDIGIPEKKTKPVLKKLLILYEKNWKLIEEENYRVLADVIFEEETMENAEDRSVPENSAADVCPAGNVLEQEPSTQEEPERPLKRIRRSGTTSNAGTPTTDGSALKEPKPEPIDEPQGCSNPEGSQVLPRKNKGKQPVSSQSPALPIQPKPSKPPRSAGRAARGLHIKEPTKESGTALDSKRKEPAANGMIIPKDEPYTDGMPMNEIPLDVIHPESLPKAAPSTTNGFSDGQDCADRINEHMVLPSSTGEKEPNGFSDTNLQSLAVLEHQQLNSDDMIATHESTDITRGEERVQISLVNESQMQLMPSFHYIRQNVIYSNANVKFSLSQIGDGDYCQTCYGNCLASSKQLACLCAKKGFAYTSEGLLKEDFLTEYMSMVRKPQKHDVVLCSTCPIEKCKNEGMLEPCKGHVKRKFIKECWVKCGCSKICANRVVQRGITYKLQVFWTTEGKGWGLRALEELPKGAFVCEYVGEVLTVKELHQRTLQKKGNMQRTYPVVLDAAWAGGNLLEDQSLCLDGTLYGNVARFINHRCLDANLVEVPVQVETSDQHYYHIGLFTTRKIDAMEELTWDYGLDFDDKDQEQFDCLCGSSFCRNIKRSTRSKSMSIAQ